MADTPDEEEPLEVFWDDLRIARHRAPAPVDEAQAIRDQVESGDLAIGSSKGRILVVIKPTGEVIFGPEYRPDEAAMTFWEAMGRQRYQFEERIILIQHMEAMLTRLGSADLRLEALRQAVAAGDENAAQLAGAGLVALERLVHQTIELGRGLARRPEIPMPDIPVRIPDRIRNNPESDYQGQAGIEADPPPDEQP